MTLICATSALTQNVFDWEIRMPTVASLSHLRAWTIVASATILAACGGGSDAPPASGTVSIAITDAPIDSAQSVVIQFSGVAFKRAGADAEIIRAVLPTAQQLDLLQYQSGRTALLLDGISLPAGNYEWVRLIVDNAPSVRDSYVTLDNGSECELRVPSGAESGLKLNRGFTLPADGSAALTIDFDLRQSVHAPPGQRGVAEGCTQGYILRPTLRLVNNANVGAISGHVDAALVNETCEPAVYVYQGAGVVPDDIEETSATTPDIDPYATATVPVVNGATSYAYRIGFVPVGDYTVTFTCASDDPTDDESVAFQQTQNATVQSNLISSVNFVATPAPAPTP
jgi:hypothetical protein